MLKKAGIIVAAAAAGLLAVSPLAFAGDKDHDYNDGGDYSYSESSDDDASTNDSGFLSGNNVSAPINVCDNTVPVNALGVQVPVVDSEALNGLSGALGLGAEAGDVDDDSVRSDSCVAESDIEDNGSATTED